MPDTKSVMWMTEEEDLRRLARSDLRMVKRDWDAKS
jgi:hypothetical protein